MAHFTVTIEELVSEGFALEAPTREEALQKALERYRQGEWVLAPGQIEMARVCLDDRPGEWVEV